MLRPLVVMLLAGTLGAGCSTYRGTSEAVDPSVVVRSGEWLTVPNFPLVRQEGRDDCGGAALASVLRFWGYEATPDSVEAAIGRKDKRLSAGEMAEHARDRGLQAFVFFGTMADVVHELERGRPVIVGLGKATSMNEVLAHYQVVVGYEPKQRRVLLLDPGSGWQIDTVRGFATEWARTGGVTIVTFLPARDTEVARLRAPARALHE